uniref:Uncharacterized protein n=1 Tax=Amphimedon queenslandica TaxID=400682 RepID=A0A1X7UQR0_AMPQE
MAAESCMPQEEDTNHSDFTCSLLLTKVKAIKAFKMDDPKSRRSFKKDRWCREEDNLETFARNLEIMATRFYVGSTFCPCLLGFLYSTDTTMLVLDCRSGDTTVISVQRGPQLKETLCEVE